MRRHSYPFSHLSMGTRLSMLMTAAVLAGSSAYVLPQYAAAEALAGPEATAGPSGLPDGRIYEQVSPQNKPGSEAGSATPYMVSGRDGNEVVYNVDGPVGEAPSGIEIYSIGRRFAAGWQSHGAVARAEGLQEAFMSSPLGGLGFSSDMAATVFGAGSVFVPEQVQHSPTPHLYRYTEDGLVQWIGKPGISDPVMLESQRSTGGTLVGGAQSGYNTVYFDFEGTLTPSDEEPNPALGRISRAQEIRIQNESANPPSSNDGFYEWHDGVLESAGVLPDGHLDPFGAAGAAIRNTVSEDGRVALFISPDPSSQSGRVSQLYVRKSAEDGTQTTEFVSRDLLLPEVGGSPAAAPDGGDFRYASPDGSRLFFDSRDQLTADAPNNTEEKIYEFDPSSESLTYRPSLSTQILASSRNGANLLFLSGTTLEFWNEGEVTEVAPVDESFTSYGGYEAVHATPSGSAYVFQGKTSFSKLGFNNGDGQYNEVYRYEPATNRLSCVSCPSAGPPTGDSELSHREDITKLTESHGLSEDGSRVLFDTPDSLVPQDTNGVRDVYLWENGVVYLISSGLSERESLVGDISPSGGDLFFSTAEGLVPGDVDGSYDVYDARIPRPGDQLPPSAVPCEGAVCQGPPSVPQLFSPPASETFNGVVNPTSLPTAGSGTPKSLTRREKRARALRSCQKRRRRSARLRCRRQARRRYGAGASRTGRPANVNRDRRGK